MSDKKLSIQCQNFIADFVYLLSPGWDDLPSEDLYLHVLRKNKRVLSKLITELKEDKEGKSSVDDIKRAIFASKLFEAYINDKDRINDLEEDVKYIIRNNSELWWELCAVGLKYPDFTSLESYIGLESHWDANIDSKAITPKQIVDSICTFQPNELSKVLQYFYKISQKEFANSNTKMSKLFEGLIEKILPVYDTCPENQQTVNELMSCFNSLTQYYDQQSDWKEKTRVLLIMIKMTKLTQSINASVVNPARQFIQKNIGSIMLNMESGELTKFIRKYADIVSQYPENFSSVARGDETILNALLDNVPGAVQPVFKDLITDDNLAPWLINWLQSCKGKTYEELEKAVIDSAIPSSDHENVYKAIGVLLSKKMDNKDTTKLDEHFSTLSDRLNFKDPSGFENVMRLMNVSNYKPKGERLEELKEYYGQFGYDDALPNVQQIRELSKKVLRVRQKSK